MVYIMAVPRKELRNRVLLLVSGTHVALNGEVGSEKGGEDTRGQVAGDRRAYTDIKACR